MNTMPFAAKISLLSNSVAMKCCQHILANVPPTAILLTSDEAHFHLTDCVNKQNFRYWARANPHEKRQLHSERVTDWCAVGEFGVLGPYFFENEDGNAVIITSARYIEMLENFLQPQLNKLAVDAEDIWFQQAGATAHTAQRTMRYPMSSFLGTSSLTAAIFLSLHDHPILCCAISYFGAI